MGGEAYSRLGIIVIAQWGESILIFKINRAGPGLMTDPILRCHRAAFGHWALGDLHVRRKDWPKALKVVLRSLQVQMWP